MNSSNCFDIGIIGSGVAGSFALKKILKNNKNMKVAVFDAGRPPLKRRHQLYGFLGCLPGSDGKLYLNDLNKVSEISGAKKTTTANKWVMEQLSEVVNMKVVKDKRPSITAEKRLRKFGYDIELNNYYQLYPKDIHSFSRSIVEDLDQNSNTLCSFDNEVFKVLKHKSYFSVITSAGEFQCKKVLISVGRSGWRWVSELFSNFGIIENNDVAKFGIRIEMPTTYMKDFNQSNCTLLHNLVEAGPLSWGGTVIPEDHIDLAISSFRSNETRWASDKVSFNLLAETHFAERGYQQTDRIGKLTFILANDRIMKEKLSSIMNKRSKISIIPEYNFLIQELEELNEVMPDLLNRGSFYAPCLSPFAPKINLKSDFMSEVKDMFVVGESANIPGILGAAVSGTVAADAISKG
jgi:uncharacterized FAD-dependent dehydrogenase